MSLSLALLDRVDESNNMGKSLGYVLRVSQQYIDLRSCHADLVVHFAAKLANISQILGQFIHLPVYSHELEHEGPELYPLEELRK